MNALELLKTDHEKVSGILEKLDQTTERAVKTRDEQFARVKEELEVHAHIEETVFYPALAEDSRTRALTLSANEQHNVVKALLDEMATIPVDTEEWTAKLKVLKDSVDQHVKEEEGEMFKQARQVLPKARLDELGEEMEAARSQDAEPAGASRASARAQGSGGNRATSSASSNRRSSGGRQSRGFSFSVSLAGCPLFFDRFCQTKRR